MERDDWQRISLENIQFAVKDIRDKLIPVLKTCEIPPNTSSAIDAWAKHLVSECKMALVSVLPFRENEIEFLEILQNEGRVKPELISDDYDLCQRIMQYPSVLWRAKQALVNRNEILDVDIV